MAKSSKVPLIAGVVAFLIAIFGLVSTLIGPVIALPLALIPLWAAIGILRKRGIIGKPILIYDSDDETSDEALKGERFLKGHTRWNRILKPI